MASHNILIVGGGIAGASAAALLGRAGHRVTLVERAGAIRSSGAPVDVRGAALDVARGLGVEPALRAADTGTRRMVFLNRAGRIRAAAPTRPSRSEDLEVARATLSTQLLAAARNEADIVMGEAPTSLTADPGGVDVAFQTGATGRFDLVVGADGQHSATRRMLWAAQERARAPLGLVVATLPVPVEVPASDILLHNEPGVSIGIHPAGGRPIASFIFRSQLRDTPRERIEQAQIVRDAYARAGWRAPELLSFLDDRLDDLYFDVVSRVRVPSWSTGRATLLGDAASSVTILGEGSSMAMLGAQALTDAIANGTDIPAALRQYEAAHRPVAEAHQRGARSAAAFLTPRSHAGIGLRDLLVRIRGRA